MFQGTIPQDLRDHLLQTVAAWPVDEVYVGCSGNFTVERTLHTLGRLRLHGNDVSLYSCALGAWLARQPFSLALRAEARELLGWLEPSLATPVGAVATLLLATRLAEGLTRDGRPRDNAYYRRLLPAYRAQWPTLHARTVERLEALPLRLASFHAGDVLPWVEGLPQEAGLVAYPPFYEGGYEALFGRLEALFAWDAPSYDVIDEERLGELFAAIADRPWWLFGSNRPWPQFAPYLRGVMQATNRSAPVFLYASAGPRRVVTPHQAVEPVLAARLLPGMRLGGRLTLGRLNGGQFNALRAQYLSPRILPAEADAAWAVQVDGVLVGAFAFARGMGPLATPDTLYLLSDFAVAPSDYPRLSKLVLYAALSHESRLLAERLAGRRVRWLFTTAFSDRPVSMKYRGLFELVSRKQNPAWVEGATGPAAYYQQRYVLNYRARLGRWTLAEGLAEWKGRYGEPEHARGAT